MTGSSRERRVISPASAYSVLTHEAIIDATWDSAIRPLLLKELDQLRSVDLDLRRPTIGWV